jgi:EAL domain-containing protein (putative c-di-GMP-specific phosphodiesterase class I)
MQIDGMWRAVVRGSTITDGLSPNIQGLVSFAVGAIISLLLAALVLVLTRSREHALGMVQEKIGQLRHQALHDGLTGLPNRVLVLDRAEQLLARARRQYLPVAALYLDIDGFKQVNDTFDLSSERIVGVEALIRWRHPTRGIVSPEEFIPIAEESGLIVPIGRWVLAEASRQAATWRRRGHTIGVAVNVSARQLDDDSLIEDVRRTLADSGLDPGALTLEVTETTLMRDADATARRLVQLKQLGVLIAIDDFGTGYSSLAYLQQFPADVLKIDRSFVSGITTSDESAALIHTLVQLGKALHIETLAEGIEDQAQLQALQREHCDHGQGFLFSRPLEVNALEQFLDDAPAASGASQALGTASV